MAAPRGVPRGLLGLLALAAVYFAAAKLGLMLAFVHASATAVWPPTGIALASMLLLGPRVWPAILLGAFLANVTTAGNLWTSLGIATGNTLEGVLGAWLVTRFANGSDAFERARDILSFGALAGFLATTVSATVGVTSLALGSYASWNDSGAIVFGDLFAPWVRSEPLEFLCIPALMWAAFRYRQRGAATSLAVLAGIAVWGTLHGAGPFVRETQNESLLLLQAFLVTLALTILPLAAVVRERARAEEGLARLAAIVESSDDAIIGKALDGTITSWNRGAERLYGYAAREVIGWPIALIIPRELDHELPTILDRLERGERIDNRETVRMRRDGRRIDVSITVSPTRDPYGGIAGAASIARDIGHRREVEIARRERDVLRSVAGLTAAVGHEINNPLAVVMGQAQLLARQVGGNERRRIDEMLDAVERIREILERMKHINKIVLLDGSEPMPAVLDRTESGAPPALDERA